MKIVINVRRTTNLEDVKRSFIRIVNIAESPVMFIF